MNITITNALVIASVTLATNVSERFPTNTSVFYASETLPNGKIIPKNTVWPGVWSPPTEKWVVTSIWQVTTLTIYESNHFRDVQTQVISCTTSNLLLTNEQHFVLTNTWQKCP